MCGGVENSRRLILPERQTKASTQVHGKHQLAYWSGCSPMFVYIVVAALKRRRARSWGAIVMGISVVGRC